jgi:polysaccharide deacetylase family protein (PEP-CTERM system associated)
MVNALTFDVEDWRQLMRWKISGEFGSPKPEVVSETEYILQILSDHGVRATFFVLANIAKTFPGLIRQIDEAGHEIGSHGFSHQLIYRQTPKIFREETLFAKSELESLIGKRVVGYRAAEFSITRTSWWALEVLADLGFEYDSSVFPVQKRRYGVPDSPLEPYCIESSGRGGARIVEVPLTAVHRFGKRRAAAGGGYFRLFPYSWTRSAIRQANQEGRAAVAYFHPYEFATTHLKIPIVPRSPRALAGAARSYCVHNFGVDRTRRRFLRLLGEFEFAPIHTILSTRGYIR